MPSWYDAWADRYDHRSAELAADVPFSVGLAREADGPLVELAVGTGRVAIAVAQSAGRRVVGIDSSPGMLARARKRAEEAGVELDLREGDIRVDITLDEGGTGSLWWATKNEWLGLIEVASREYVFVARRVSYPGLA